jgi:hypothetical protein
MEKTMSECLPAVNTCDGDGALSCECTCDNCEGHIFECPGCDLCRADYDDGTSLHEHHWERAVDPKWMVCVSQGCSVTGQRVA